MAKKTAPTDKKKKLGTTSLSRAAKKVPPRAEKTIEKSTLAKAKDVVVHAAESVAEVVSDAAHAAQEHVIQPVAEAVGITKKAKRPKIVRVKTEPKPKPAPLPPPSKTSAGKMMSKNVKTSPQEKPAMGSGKAPKK